MRRLIVVLFSVCATVAAITPATAQTLGDPLRSENEFETGIVGRFEERGGIVLNPVTVSAQVAPATDDRPALLLIRAKIAEGRHSYSITQPPGGPTPTKINLERSADFRQIAPFQSDPPPNTRTEKGPIWTGLEIQEHEGELTWYAPIEPIAGVDPTTLEILGTIAMEVCQTGGYCEPVERSFTAKLAKNVQLSPAISEAIRQALVRNPQSTNESYQPKNSSVSFSGRLVPASVAPGQSAELEITATLPPGSRIYAHADRDDRLGTKPFLIAIEQASGLVPQRPTTDAVIQTDNSVPQFGPMRYHEGAVTWTVKVDVPAKAEPGKHPISGLIGYQSCEYHDDGKNVCELPQAVRFETTVAVGDSSSEVAPLRFGPGGNYSQVSAIAAVFADFLGAEPPAEEIAKTGAAEIQDDVPVIGAADPYDLNRIQLEGSNATLGYYIALAFVGGLILNLMPCVLPVIGLKVMSFVEQAHKSRSHALVLNLWFAAGIVAVFLLLGLLAATLGLSWGGQFGSTPFNVTIAAVVFAMALSLLGVWEIPIPGFFGSGSVQKAAAQEGPLGAFLKGVVTTVLATPCTAPFMAAAVAWAVAQPLITTLVVFGTLGIGMASPYLLVGVYPELLRFLPKPGAWMETFKQVSGFVLLATVVFILSFIESAAVVPTVALLLGIAVACWLISRTSVAAELRDRLQNWALAGAVVLLFAAFSFGWLYGIAGGAAQTAWQPFSLERLKQVAVDDGRTVLVDFSAEWCLNCKFFEHTVLHAEPVEKAIARSGAVTMYADYTKYPPEIDRTIKALKSNGVPVIAVFPGDSPYNPIVFRGSYTQQELVAALEKATGRRLQGGGPSVAEASSVPAL